MNEESLSDERRRFPRIPVGYTVSIIAADNGTVDMNARGTVLNMSREGLCMRMQFNASVGSIVSVGIVFRDHDSLLLSEVMWKREENAQFLYGLKIKKWCYLDSALERELEDKSLRPDSAQPPRQHGFQRFPDRLGDSFLAFGGGMNPVPLV